MTKELIEKKLLYGGYRKIQTGVSSLKLFLKEGNPSIIICLVERTADFAGQTSLMDSCMERFQKAIETQYSCQSRLLAIIYTEDIGRDKCFNNSAYPVWFLTEEGKRVVFENQPGGFEQLEALLETKINPINEFLKNRDGDIPWCMYTILLLNLLVQLVVFWQETRYGSSSLQNQFVLILGRSSENGSYYRLLTSAFLHFGWTHLFNNMLVLFYLGRIAEKLTGHFRFLVIYLLSAVGANIASVIWYAAQGRAYVYSAGASGAVFGIAGLLLFLLLLHRGRIAQISSRQIVLMMIFTIYHGFTESGVNNCAHIAGAVIGFLSAFLLWLLQKRKNVCNDRIIPLGSFF